MYPTRRKSSPRPEESPISWRLSRLSQGSDCQIRRFSEPSSLQALEDPQRAQPAVLVVHGHDSAGQRERDRLARGVDHLVLGRADVGVAEVPGAFLAEDARRLAVLVPLDHAAGHLELGVGEGERRGVDPERVVVLGHQRDRHVAGDSVERLLRRLDRRRPLAVPPAEPAQPAALRAPRRPPRPRARARRRATRSPRAAPAAVPAPRSGSARGSR